LGGLLFGLLAKKSSKIISFVRNPTQLKTLNSHSAIFGYLVADRFTSGAAQHFRKQNRSKEALMAGMRSDRARARARDLLATVYPIPDDAEFRRLRELAMDYIQEAERLEAEDRGRMLESDELISTALDAVARDFFARALLRAVSHKAR
jgi:hypothetical protein